MSNETMHASDVTPVLFPSDKARFMMLYNIGRLYRWYAVLLGEEQERDTVMEIARDMNTVGHMQVSLATAGGITRQEIVWFMERLDANELSTTNMTEVMVSLCDGSWGI
jgi:hypothetical protein